MHNSLQGQKYNFAFTIVVGEALDIGRATEDYKTTIALQRAD